jgi:hypothetical protein
MVNTADPAAAAATSERISSWIFVLALLVLTIATTYLILF